MMRFLSLLLLLVPLFAFAEITTPPTIRQCDALYVAREKPETLQQSINCYQQILNADPKNFEVAWKLAKSFWYQGNHAPKNKAAYFQKGIDAAKQATDIDPGNCEGHFWLGLNYAMYGENSSFFRALGIVDDVKDQMKEAMAIREDCECAGPQRVLGKLYDRLPWFKGGSRSKSIEYLKKSVQICPADTQSRLFLAEIYLDQGKKDLALEQLYRVMNQQPDPAWIPETKENKIKAAEMLNKLKKDNAQ